MGNKENKQKQLWCIQFGKAYMAQSEHKYGKGTEANANSKSMVT